MAYYEGEISPITTGNGNGSGFGWGGDWIWAFLIFALLGWGNGGFGGGYGRQCGSSNGGVMDAYVLNSDFATLSRQVDSGFDRIGNRIEAVNNGICSLGYDQLAQINGVNMNIANGFARLDTSLCQLGNNVYQGQTAIQNQIASCCCDLRAGLKDVQYTMAQDTCSIKQAIAENTNAVLGFLTNEKISALQAENAGLKAQISNDKQSAYLLNELKPCPRPAYITCNPYQSYPFYTNGGFGCGASVQ